MYLPMTEKRFSSQKKAEQWARAFDYSRSLLGLPPLAIQQDGESWIIAAPKAGE
jgi:hypothetical protein